jgi:hypothetical protein
MAAKISRLTHKIAIQQHLVAESCTICSSRSRRPVRKLSDTPWYYRHLEMDSSRALLGYGSCVVPLKRWYPSTTLHGVTTQKNLNLHRRVASFTCVRYNGSVTLGGADMHLTARPPCAPPPTTPTHCSITVPMCVDVR